MTSSSKETQAGEVTTDQIIVAVVFGLPMLVLSADYRGADDLPKRLILALALPWAVFTVTWAIAARESLGLLALVVSPLMFFCNRAIRRT